MARITLERKVKVDENIHEIKTVTYEIPDKIVFNDLELEYDPNTRNYTDHKFTQLPAIKYLKIRLNNLDAYLEN